MMSAMLNIEHKMPLLEEFFTTLPDLQTVCLYLYHSVDEKEVYRILQENLQDFPLFLKAIARNNFN